MPGIASWLSQAYPRYMTGRSSSFLRDGMVFVEDALQPEFCEEVIAHRLGEIGVDEDDPRTWRSGWHNLPATTVYALEQVAPTAAAALHELVGGSSALEFGGLPDNLIVNFPDPGAAWWSPTEWDSPAAGWHKDGDWYRHFLDSAEQGVLGVVFWRDVTERQGATYVVADSIAPVARLLADHPEGIDPAVPIADIVARSHDIRALTARQGTIVWAHPFLVHSASVNGTDRLRIISNTTAILRQPLVLSGPGQRTPIEQVVLNALGVDDFPFRATRERRRIVSERERRWKALPAADDATVRRSN
jgi:hypothetical protein